MAWFWTGNKPISEPMMSLFTDAYRPHPASMSDTCHFIIRHGYIYICLYCTIKDFTMEDTRITHQLLHLDNGFYCYILSCIHSTDRSSETGEQNWCTSPLQFPKDYLSLLGFVRTRVLMSRSRLNNGATHGGWHLTFTGILTPGDASVASCSLWYHDQPKLVPSPQYTSITLRYTIGDGKLPAVWAVTLVTLKIQMYPDGYQICILRVTIGGYRITAW